MTLLYDVVEFGEHPHLTPLQPDELVRVINTSVTIKTGEVAAEIMVLALVKPERNNAVEKFCAVLLRQLLEISHFFIHNLHFLFSSIYSKSSMSVPTALSAVA